MVQAKSLTQPLDEQQKRPFSVQSISRFTQHENHYSQIKTAQLSPKPKPDVGFINKPCTEIIHKTGREIEQIKALLQRVVPENDTYQILDQPKVVEVLPGQPNVYKIPVLKKTAPIKVSFTYLIKALVLVYVSTSVQQPSSTNCDAHYCQPKVITVKNGYQDTFDCQYVYLCLQSKQEAQVELSPVFSPASNTKKTKRKLNLEDEESISQDDNWILDEP